MIDLDEIERILNDETGRWNVSPDAISGLVAEVRALREDLQAAKLLAHANAEMFKAEKADNEALRAELNTPLLTGAYAPMYEGIFAAEGINHDVAMSAFYANAPTVTVYYGRRHVYTCMAEFCAEYSKEKA